MLSVEYLDEFKNGQRFTDDFLENFLNYVAEKKFKPSMQKDAIQKERDERDAMALRLKKAKKQHRAMMEALTVKAQKTSGAGRGFASTTMRSMMSNSARMNTTSRMNNSGVQLPPLQGTICQYHVEYLALLWVLALDYHGDQHP